MTARPEDPTTDSQNRIALIGGIHMDRIATGARDIRPDTSTPGAIVTRPGGVAGNVARVLAQLDAGCTPGRVALAGRLGEDADGKVLRADLEGLGIDVSAIRASTLPTASYLALHHPDGRLAAALSDTAITEEIAAADFAPLPRALAAAGWWFLDANLTEEALQALCGVAEERRIAADAVSIAKATRLKPCLARIDLLFANRDEAVALLDDMAPLEHGAENLARALCAAGVQAAVVTDGAAGVAWCRKEATGMTSARIAALPVRVRHVTGAGDALIGGTLGGLLDGLMLEPALMRGLASAALTLEGRDISLHAMEARLASAGADP